MNKRIVVAVLIVVAVGVVAYLVANKLTFTTITSTQGVTQANTLYTRALSWQNKGNNEESVKLLQELVKTYPDDPKAALGWFSLAQLYESSNLLPNAKEAYSAIIVNFPEFDQIKEIEARLWDLNVKLLFSPVITDSDFVYKVEAGDTLSKIGAKYNTTVDLIMKSNNLENTLIRPGNRLKIPTRTFSVIVNKTHNTLTLKADEQIFKVYRIATGKYGCTPLGNFTIVEKLINPDWYKAGRGVVPADNPENILGTRWLGLSEPQYGIHGGATEEDLGHQVTDGCVRMIDAEVEELFTVLPRGTQVAIVD